MPNAFFRVQFADAPNQLSTEIFGQRLQIVDISLSRVVAKRIAAYATHIQSIHSENCIADRA